MELLYYLLSSFGNLAPWTRWVFVILPLLVILGLGALLTPMVGIIVAIGLVVIGLAIGGFRFLLHRKRQKKSAEFGGELRTASGVTPGQINDPAQRQRLEDLRQSFEKGLEKF